MKKLVINKILVIVVSAFVIAMLTLLAVGCASQNSQEDMIKKAAENARQSIRNNSYDVAESNEVEKFEVMVPVASGVALKTMVVKPVGDGP